MSDEARATERPATFREVFANSEFRAVYTAFSLSWLGDYLAKAAVTALVYQRTNSVALSAATFALSFLPWVVGGPVLAALADRYRYRSVMILCDVIRMALIALVAIPGIPVAAMLVLLFVTSLANPPAQAAKSALMPLILTRDRLVVGLALNTSTGQAAQIAGYLAGAAMAPFFPRLALVIDSVTFGVSALLIRFGVRDRPPATAAAQRRHIMRETAEGFGLVFGTPVLRAVAVMVFAVMLFSIVPEGLAAAWAAEVTQSDTERGVSQGMIMAANPIGFILGGLLITRLVRPSRRQKLIRPFAILAPLALVPALFAPSPLGVSAMAALCGFAVAGMMPTANGLFVQALPHGYRARAFGVMQSGIQIMQGLAVLGTGLLADVYPLHTVVGVWSMAGVLLMLVVTAWWPSPSRFAAAIAAASRTGQPVDLEDTTVDLQDHAIKIKSREAEATVAAAPPQAGLPPVGLPQAGQLYAGSPQTGQPYTGSPLAGSPRAGQPHTGSPLAGLPQAGQPHTGSPQTGQPQAGQPNTGQPQTGQPHTGSLQAGSLQAGSLQAGPPQAGQPQAGQPQTGRRPVGAHRAPEPADGTGPVRPTSPATDANAPV